MTGGAAAGPGARSRDGARRRAAAALAALALGAGACSTGVVVQRPCAGRVVDARSGEALAGAEVFELRSLSRWIQLDAQDVAARWTTADAAGRFAFACELALTAPRLFVRATGPHYEVFHPRVGLAVPAAEPSAEGLRLAVAPGPPPSREDALRCPPGALPGHCRRRCELVLGAGPCAGQREAGRGPAAPHAAGERGAS